MNNKKTNDFQFSITNVIGEDIDDIIVYSNEGYTIMTRIDTIPNGYRKNVLWNFGDGNSKIGYNVSHYYTKPGKYEITCTLFNSTTKEGILQECRKTIYVKELIPSSINVISSKSEIKCSKIEKLASLECLLSNSVSNKLDVNVKKLDSSINSYFDVKDKDNYHIKEKYWTLLRNEKQFYYGANKVYSNNLVPTELFTPSYTKLYYKFNDKLSDITLYQIAKSGEIASDYKTIKILKPNCKVNEEVYDDYTIESVSDESELPQNAIYCGMRGFVDIFYKTDEIDESENFSIFYDIENKSITNDLETSTNYINIIPIGLSVKSIANTNDIKVGVSGNYFLNDNIGDSKVHHKTPIFIDRHLEASLYNGLDLNCYIFPFCSYENDDVIGGYYIPKDVRITPGDIEYSEDLEYGLNSKVLEDKIENENNWLIKLPIELQNYIDVVIPITVNANKKHDVRIYKKPLRNLNQLDIPQEKATHVNIDELLNSYMRHPSLTEKKNLRDMLKAYLNGIIPQTQSNSENFIDNVANIRTCYLSNLLSQIKMMGEDVIEFENTNLEGINDLKNLVRFISMNHTDLVGHKTDVDWDISVNSDSKGKNVGAKIGIRDTLTLCNDVDEQDNLTINFGKIKKVQRYGENEIHDVELCDVIVRDKFTNKTEIVNFRKYLKNTKSSTVKLEDYDSSWGWNLLLPDGFENISNKIKELETYDDKKIPYYKNEKIRLQHSKRELIHGYYDFYYLIPKEDSERRGNFLDEKYINKSIESVEKWDESLGVAHDMLMKVLLTNGELLSKRNIADVYNGMYEDVVLKPTYIYKEIPVSSFNNVLIKMIMRENTSLVPKSIILPLDGILTIQGKIYGEGKNDIWIELKNGKIDEKEDFTIDDSVQTLNVRKVEVDGQNHLEIEKKVMEFDINGNLFNFIIDGVEYKSKIIVTVSGNINRPTIETDIQINYKPYIIKGHIEENLTYHSVGQVIESFDTIKQDDNFNNGLPFKLKLNCSGFIEGEGKNRLIVNQNNSSFYFDKDNELENYISVLNFDTELDGIVLEYDVKSDGSISGSSRIYNFGGIFEEVPNQQKTLRSFEGKGSFKLVIGGTTEKPEISFEVVDNFRFIFNYPELYTRYDDWQFVDIYQSNSKLFDKSSGMLNSTAIIHSTFNKDGERGEENYYDVERNTYLNDFSIRLIAADEEQDSVKGESRTYNCEIVGYYKIDPYNSIYYPNYIWNFSHEVSGRIGQVVINEFGDIVTPCNLVFSNFGQDVPFINKSFELHFIFEGNVPDSTVKCNIESNIQPEGVYLEAFNLNEIYEINDSDNYEDGIATINGCSGIDKVSVCFVDKNGAPYNRIFMKDGFNDLSSNPPYISIELYNEKPEKELICSWNGQFIQNINGNIYGDECIISKGQDDIWKVHLDKENIEVCIESKGFYIEHGHYYDLQTYDENKNEIYNNIIIDEDISIKNFVLNVLKRTLLSYNHERILYTNESEISTGDDLNSDILGNKKYIGKCAIFVIANGFKPIFSGDKQEIELNYSIATSVIVKDNNSNVIEEIKIEEKENQIIKCWIKAINGDKNDNQYCLYQEENSEEYLDTTVGFDSEYLDTYDGVTSDETSAINYRYKGIVNFKSYAESLTEEEWKEEDYENIIGKDRLILGINFATDSLEIISRLLKGEKTLSLDKTNAYWVKDIDDNFYNDIDNPEVNGKYEKTDLSEKDFDLTGNVTFKWMVKLDNNEQGTQLEITAHDSGFYIGRKEIQSNQLFGDDDSITTPLQDAVSGNVTMTLDGGKIIDGVSIIFSTQVTVKVDKGEVSLTPRNSYLKYIDYNYTVNFDKTWEDVTNFSNWIDEQKHDDLHHNGITGSIHINDGKGNEESFGGTIIIQNQKLNGVYLTSISDVAYQQGNGSITEVKDIQYDSQNKQFKIPLKGLHDLSNDEDNLLKLKFTLSSGENFTFTPELNMYRNQVSREGFESLVNPFEINGDTFNVSLNNNYDSVLPDLMTIESNEDSPQILENNIGLYNEGDDVTKIKDVDLKVFAYVKGGIIYSNDNGESGNFECQTDIKKVEFTSSDNEEIHTFTPNDDEIYTFAGEIKEDGVIIPSESDKKIKIKDVDRNLTFSGSINVSGNLVKDSMNDGLPKFEISDLKVVRGLIDLSAQKEISTIFNIDSDGIIYSNGNIISGLKNDSTISFNDSAYWGDDFKDGQLSINKADKIKINDLTINVPESPIIQYKINTDNTITTNEPKNILFSDSRGIVKMSSYISLGGSFKSPQIKTENTNVTIAKWPAAETKTYKNDVTIGNREMPIQIPITLNPVTDTEYPGNGFLGNESKKYIELGQVTIGNIKLNATNNVTSESPITLSYNEDDISYNYTKPANSQTSFTLSNTVAGITLDYTIEEIKEKLSIDENNTNLIKLSSDNKCYIDNSSYTTISQNVAIIEKPLVFSKEGFWKDVFVNTNNGIEIEFNGSKWEITNPKVKVFNYLDFKDAFDTEGSIKVNGFTLQYVLDNSQIGLDEQNKIIKNDIRCRFKKDYGKGAHISLEANLPWEGQIQVDSSNNHLELTGFGEQKWISSIYVWPDGKTVTVSSNYFPYEANNIFNDVRIGVSIKQNDYVKANGNKAEIEFDTVKLFKGEDLFKKLTCENKILNYNIDDETGKISISNDSFDFLYTPTDDSNYKITGTLTVTANDNAKFSGEMFKCSVSDVTYPVCVDYDDDGQIRGCDLTSLENANNMFGVGMKLKGTSVGNIIKGLDYNTSIDTIILSCYKSASTADKEALNQHGIILGDPKPKTIINKKNHSITYYFIWWNQGGE